MERRKFLEKAGRMAILTSVAAISGFVILKNRKYGGDECIIESGCAKCGKNTRCSLPQAIKFRNNGGR